MKPILSLITALLLLCAPLRAQDGLAINQAFRGDIVHREDMVEVRVKGQPIQKYGLTYYHSVAFKATKAQQRQVEALVKTDQKAATGSETTLTNLRMTIILQLPPKDSVNRFLCYISKTAKVILVYMEGQVDSIEELKKVINGNN